MGVKKKITKSNSRPLHITEAFKVYLSEKKSLNRAEATLISIEGSFKRWQEWLNSNDMRDVNEDNIRVWCAHCLSEDMKPTTLNHYLRDIRAFVYWCASKNYIEKFPIILVKEQETIKETYSDEDVLKLIERPRNSASFVEWRSWAIVNWILATGNRASTVRNVKVEDVDFKAREIYITKTKTKKALIMPLSPALSNALTEYMRLWRAECDSSAYLFPNIGVQLASIHAFRHTFAKDWIRNNGDVFRLQKMLQHTTLEMTRHYVNMFSEDLKEDFEEVNPLDNLKSKSSRTRKVKRCK